MDNCVAEGERTGWRGFAGSDVELIKSSLHPSAVFLKASISNKIHNTTRGDVLSGHVRALRRRIRGQRSWYICWVQVSCLRETRATLYTTRLAGLWDVVFLIDSISWRHWSRRDEHLPRRMVQAVIQPFLIPIRIRAETMHYWKQRTNSKNIFHECSSSRTKFD